MTAALPLCLSAAGSLSVKRDLIKGLRRLVPAADIQPTLGMLPVSLPELEKPAKGVCTSLQCDTFLSQSI